MAPRQLLLIVLAFLAISETSTSSSNQWRRRYRSPPMWRRCHRLPYLCNGQVTKNGWSKIDYVCNPGYKLAVTADCLRGNSWTPRVTCEEILCESEPVLAANSSLDGDIVSRRPGAEYNFTCYPGFGHGMGKVVCDESGKWNVDEVECEEILCESEPVLAANSSLDGDIVSRRPGAEYNFTCYPGFGHGMGKVVCDESGKWNVDEVECEECIVLKGFRVLFFRQYLVFSSEDQCTAECARSTYCNLSLWTGPLCEFFPLPVVAISRPADIQGCIDACAANDECKLLASSFNLCFLLNTDDIDSLTTQKEENYTTLGKNCQL